MLGTRPEGIKLAPVILELRKHPALFNPQVICTSQHRVLAAAALAAFDLSADVDLKLADKNSSPTEFIAHAMLGLRDVLQAGRPDIVLVQGDTSTVVAAVLTAGNEGIPVGHIEAGLRSGDRAQPFPEEDFRRYASAGATLHFAPTRGAAENLRHAGITTDIYITGNTIVDAVMHRPRRTLFSATALNQLDWEHHRVLLATVHRRENLGEHIRHIGAALRELSAAHTDLHIVLPLHPNPALRAQMVRECAMSTRIHLLEPLDYADTVEVLHRCYAVLTDSGGLQEEAAALRKPVLILRQVTERPEVIAAGFGRLVGHESGGIFRAVNALLNHPADAQAMTQGANPFGDGRAAQRIATVLAARYASCASTVDLGRTGSYST